MLRDLIKEGSLYTLANLLTKGISLLLIPFYTAYFSPEDYGIIEMLVVFGTILGNLVSLQLNQGLGRYVTDSDITDEKKKLIASTAIWFICIAYVVVSGIIILFPGVFIPALSNDHVLIPKDAFRAAVVAVSINGVFFMLGVYLRFLRKTKVYTLTSFFHALLSILLTLFFVLIMDLGIIGVYYASIVTAPIIIFFQLFALKDHLVLAFDNSLLKKLLKFSLPLVPASLAFITLNFIDRIFIKEYLSFDDEGIYAIGAKFASIISIIVLGFSSALAPIVYQKHKDENTQQELGRIFRLFFVIGTVGVLGLSLFSKEMLIIFTQKEYYDAQIIMPVLYLSVFINGIGMFAPGLHLKEKTKIIPFIVLTAAVINIGLNHWLILEYQLFGAGLATVISMFINNYLMFYFSQKYFKIPLDNFKLFISVLVFIGLWVFGSYYFDILEVNLAVSLILKGVLIGIYILYLRATNMFTLKKLISFIKK